MQTRLAPTPKVQLHPMTPVRKRGQLLPAPAAVHHQATEAKPQLSSLRCIREHCHLADNRLTHIQRLLVRKPALLQSSATRAMACAQTSQHSQQPPGTHTRTDIVPAAGPIGCMLPCMVMHIFAGT